MSELFQFQCHCPLARLSSACRLSVVVLLAWAVAGAAAAAPPNAPTHSNPPNAPTQSHRIALLPMVVHSAERPEYLRDGLADMLSSRLDRVEGLDVLRIDDASKATTSLTRALERGREAGVDFVLFGSFTRFGEGASLDVQCAATEVADTRAPLREIFVHSGSIGDVIPDLDELVGKVARFVDRDFSQGTGLASAQQPKSGASVKSMDELRDRVNALEAALAELTTGAGPNAVAAPSDSAATAEDVVR